MTDRIDQWRIFAAVAGRRSFAGAARSLARSPQAVTRAVAALEARLATRLLNRTTRSVSLTGDGERYLARCQHALAEVDALESSIDPHQPLTGRLSVAAPVLLGQMHVLPVVCEFLAAHPQLDVRLALLDRVVALADEGIDVAVRVGHLPDSALRARRVGQVRVVACASPDYLRRHGVPRTPAALAEHACIAFTATTPVADRWSFPGGGRGQRSVAVRPRLVVNTGQAAIDAALAGLGVARLLSYQVRELVAARRLRVVLAGCEPEALPVHLVHLPGIQPRAAAGFVELAAGRLADRLTPAARRR